MEQYGKIYKIENQINHKVYIGQTIQKDVIKDRYYGNVEKHTHNPYLKASINKYGWDNFSVEIIDTACSNKELDEKEIYWIKKYNSTNSDYGYNLAKGGYLHGTSPEGKARFSAKMRQWWNEHPEMKEKMSNRQKGENNPLVKKGGHSEADRQKMREIRKKMIADGIIDMEKALRASHNPVSQRKRTLSKSKYIYIQYDLQMNEIRRWHTIKDMYKDLVADGIETHYKCYGSYKLSHSQNNIINKDMYKDKGILIRKYPKEMVEVAS